MILGSIKQVYFIGIGGIGMSALARFFKSKGMIVGGYDRTESPLTRNLVSEGIYVTYDDKMVTIPMQYMERESTLVVYTPAVGSDNHQLTYFRNHNFKIGKRAEVLGMLAQSMKLIGVAGTHGKTTISTMTTYLMRCSSMGCSAFLGGISKNFNSNFVVDNNSKWLVAEADEYDRSFLKLFPDIAVVSAVEADHLDIYGSYEEVKKTFNKYVGQIRKGGSLIHKYGLEFDNKPENVYTYSLDNSEADFYTENIRNEEGSYVFDIVTPDSNIKGLKSTYPGIINIENMTAAVAASLIAGVSAEEISGCMEGFSGVLRRFDVKYKSDNCVYIDDYAHHPEELRAVLSSVRALYPNKEITCVFQPHLFTRTRDFADGFAEALSLSDRVILLDIYPAREEPLEGVSSRLIADKITKPVSIMSKDYVLGFAEDFSEGVLMTLGAGDIDRLTDDIANKLKGNKV